MSKLHFNIAGGFTHFNIIKDFIKKFKNIYNLTVYDGLNYCAWNSGRINRLNNYNQDIHNFYKDNNTSIALTFSNNIIDLNDKTGNNLLEIFHDSNNYIILINNNLRKYIRKYYPKYKLIYSITGVCLINVPMQEYDISFYKQLEDDYDYIVPRYEHVFDNSFNKLDKSKYEIIININNICLHNCNLYNDHYNLMSLINRYYADKNPWDNLDHKYLEHVEDCLISNGVPKFDYNDSLFSNNNKYHIKLSNEQIEKLINQGFNRFKIAGRELNKVFFFNELSYYLEKKNLFFIKC
jgi:hypothetical protein